MAAAGFDAVTHRCCVSWWAGLRGMQKQGKASWMQELAPTCAHAVVFNLAIVRHYG